MRTVSGRSDAVHGGFWRIDPARVAIAGLGTRLGAQAAVRGQWRTLPYLMPINPVHLALVTLAMC